jgi:hypothetical protein
MIVCKSLNWVHIPKTGGWWVIDALTRVRQNPDLTRPHKSLADLPLELQNRPSYFVVRNPWDWYESFWSYLCARKKIRHLWTGAEESKTESLTEDQKFYWSVGDMDFRTCVFEMGKYRSFSSWMDRVAFRSDGTRAVPVLFDRLRSNVEVILRPAGSIDKRRFKSWCRTSGKINTSSHEGVVWERDMEDYVALVDRPVIHEFGFEPRKRK